MLMSKFNSKKNLAGTVYTVNISKIILNFITNFICLHLLTFLFTYNTFFKHKQVNFFYSQQNTHYAVH